MEHLLPAVIAALLILFASMVSVKLGVSVALYGLNAGILDRAQFSVLVTVVVASAVIPTVIAQRWFSPKPLIPPLRTAQPPIAVAEERGDV